jgi:hypothetical protein
MNEGTPMEQSDMNPPTSDRRQTRFQVIGVTLAVVLMVGIAVAIVVAMQDTPPSRASYEVAAVSDGADYQVVIPPGTAALAAGGQNVEFFPEGFTMKVGETLRIRNIDNASATLGPFVIGPGETLTQRFTQPGDIEGYCSFTEDRRTFFTVVPA